jgi:hypothetical protein
MYIIESNILSLSQLEVLLFDGNASFWCTFSFKYVDEEDSAIYEYKDLQIRIVGTYNGELQEGYSIECL